MRVNHLHLRCPRALTSKVLLQPLCRSHPPLPPPQPSRRGGRLSEPPGRRVLRVAARHARRAGRPCRHGRRLRRLPRLLHVVVFHQGPGAREGGAGAHRRGQPAARSGRHQRQPCSWASTSRAIASCSRTAIAPSTPHRPETCRTYDCRVFAAAGMNAGPDKTVINERIARWRFDYPSERDRTNIARSPRPRISCGSIRSAFPAGAVPSRPSEIAVLAVKSYEVFLNPPRIGRGNRRGHR